MSTASDKYPLNKFNNQPLLRTRRWTARAFRRVPDNTNYVGISRGEFFVVGGVTYYGVLKRWNGSSWVKEPSKAYVGGSLQVKPAKRWSGSAWLLIDSTGV